MVLRNKASHINKLEFKEFSTIKMEVVAIYNMIKTVSIHNRFEMIDQLDAYDGHSFLSEQETYYSNYTFVHDTVEYDSTMHLTPDRTGIYISNTTGYYHPFDVMVNGTWNTEIFFDVEGLNSAEIQFQLDLGMVPLVEFEYLQPIVNAAMITYLREEIDFYAQQSDIYAYITLLMGNVDLGYLSSQYKKIVSDKIMEGVVLYDSETDSNVTLAEIHPGLIDDHISRLFAYRDSDVYSHGSEILQTKMINEKIEENNRLQYLSASNVVSAELRRKVFGPNLEFVSIRPTDWFDTSIFMYYDSMMDNVAINPVSCPLYSESGLDYLDVAHSLQIFHGNDYSGITPQTTMSNLQGFIHEYYQMYKSTTFIVRDMSNMFGMFDFNPFTTRDIGDLPGKIQRILNKMLSLNLHDKASQILFQQYLERIGFVMY